VSRREAARLYFAVGFGAGLGALLRFLVGIATTMALGLSGLLATGLVNVVGSFIIVFFATISGPDGRLMIGPAARQFVMSGFCGGLTTFSSMSLDAYLLLSNRGWAPASVYLGASVLLSLLAGWLGYALAVRLNR
jgi:fluoride exporter